MSKIKIRSLNEGINIFGEKIDFCEINLEGFFEITYYIDRIFYRIYEKNKGLNEFYTDWNGKKIIQF